MSDELKEIADRVRRIETRQIKIAEAQGLDPTGKDRVRQKGKVLIISGLDVSVGNLLDFLKKSGNSGSVVVAHGDESLMTVQLLQEL